MATAALFRFLEIFPEIFAADATGSMADVGGDQASTPALTIPDVVTSLTGRGREFGDDIGMVGAELVADSTRLVRDSTIRAILTYEISAAINGDIGTICARGLQGSAAERILFGLEIERVNSATATIRARWQESGGTDAVVAGVNFVVPTGYFQVAVSRLWISTTEVQLTYMINELVIGTETVTEGDIGNGTGGSFTVGCAGDGAGNYERFLPDGSIIDMLAIDDDAMCVEEIAQELRRITVHQPAGYQLLRSYVPPGSTLSKNPTSRVQRWLAAEGDALGAHIARAEQTRDDFLPDRAYGPALEYWEKVTKNSPGPADTIQQRRNRVIGFLQRLLGHQIDELKTSLEPLFGLTSAQIQLLEYDALRTDDFSTDDITTPPSSTWVTRDGEGAILVAAGVCAISAGAGANLDWYGEGGEPARREASLGVAVGREADGATLITKIDLSLFPVTDILTGHVWRTGSQSEALIIGRRYVGGVDLIATYRITAGVAGAISNVLVPGSMADPIWLLTRFKGSGKYEVAFSETGPLTGFSSYVEVDGPDAPLWCGFGIFGNKGAALGAAVAVDFDDATIYEPNGTRGLNWQAYRNPALGGSYDIEAAHEQIQRQGPAHGDGAAVDDSTGFKLGPTGDGKLGRDPLFPSDQIVT